MRTTHKANPFPYGIPSTYDNLVRVWVPKAIHDVHEFENASEVMNALAGHNLNSEQEAYLETVAILVDEYDRAHKEQPKKSNPIEVLLLLMEEHDLSGRAVGSLLGNKALGGFILRGERHITLDQAKILGRHFSVNPSLFLDL